MYYIRKMNIISVALILFMRFIYPSFGQISIEVVTQDAICSGKGSIQVNAPEGKAPYAYEIIDNL